MDQNLIYTKTASGEEAMRQRTRVVQRNMRMVLILVDGKASVADLCAKTSNPQMTEGALRDLEQGGFIEPIMAQDSVWEQSKKVAQEIKAAALGRDASASSPDARKEDRRAKPRVEPSFTPVPTPVLRETVDSSFSSFSIAPIPSLERAAISKVSSFGVESVLDLPQAPQAPEAPQAETPALRDRLKALLSSKKPQDAGGDVSIKAIRRGGNRYYISWPLALIYGVLGAGLLVFLAAILFPYASYLPEVEAELARISGQPAKVGDMRAGFYPRPGLFLDDVRLGNAGDGKEMRISEIRLLPALGTIMARRKVFREVELTGVSLPADALAGLSGMFEAAAQPSASTGVQHVTLEKTELSFRGLALSGMSGEVKLTPDGQFNSLVLHTPSRNLLLQVKPAAVGVDVALEVYGWRPSPASLFVLDSGNVNGNFSGAALALSKIELRVFGGLIRGAAVLRADKQPSMAGEISFERISARRFGEALGIGAQFDGETTGKMNFSATADAWPAIFSGVNAEGDFSMHRGVLGAIDLAEAVRRTSAAPARGGSTRFEVLSGRFRVAPDSYRFYGLALNSGLMQSAGQLTVSKDLQVSGSMEVQMRGTVNQLRMPVSISGPLKAPFAQAGSK